MRYAYALSTALLLSGAAATLTLNAGAQTAQNEPGAITAAAPRPGAPMSFADMVAKLQPAVVNISTTQRVKVESVNPLAGTPWEGMVPQGQGGGPTTQKAESLGSGFIISADGYIVTNNHVISPGETKGAVVESITVTLPDRREFKAKLIGNDAVSDLAVLKIEGDALPFVKLGDSNATRVGDWVVAIGNPFGLGGSVTAGIVSAVHRGIGQFDRFIQTDASINRGNSGGPMFDLNGNVIGINSQILSPTGGNVGIGFAIPTEQAQPIIETLMKGAQVKRGYLGVGIQPITPDLATAFGVEKGTGELITDVKPNEAAAKAGIQRGDIVIKIGDKDVTSDQTLSHLTSAIAPGTRVPFEVLRDGKRMTFPVTLGARPPEDKLRQANLNEEGADPSMGSASSTGAAALGLQVVTITPDIARRVGADPATRGVAVAQVAPNSDAAGKGVQYRDVILSANRKPIASVADLDAIVAATKKAGGNIVALLVQRNDEQGQTITRFVPVEISR